ncbi:MAG: Por secretion system protein, partial [Duncaniella sp.]|nr:Por secretion system protein [Duncaniella sp.]
PSNSHDNSQNGATSNVYIDCYKLDGTKLWRVDLGPNIRAGAHYTQYLVYDFDGDGKAEMAVKTAPGTKDGKGNNVILGNDDPTKKYANSNGHVISGPEYLTVFDGQTGAERATVYYEPKRDILTGSQWGDCETVTRNDNYNRPERYLACVAYLDGDNATPSIVMCRGYYSAAYVCAWKFDGTKLTKKWMHESTTKGAGLYGEGAHSITVGDVDNDGCDEIIFGSAALDHDGSLLHRTHGGHGDALHLGDFCPDRPGLEVFMVHEETNTAFPFDASLRDAKTGEIIWSAKNSKNDIGRGIAGAFIPSIRGYQFQFADWTNTYTTTDNGKTVTKARNGVFDIDGNRLSESASDMNFRIYWDGDLFDETFDGRYSSTNGGCSPRVGKPKSDYTKGWDYTSIGSGLSVRSCNTTKATPNLQADIFGDWREEIILWDGDNSSDLLIFSTTIPSKYRIPTLMED